MHSFRAARLSSSFALHLTILPTLLLTLLAQTMFARFITIAKGHDSPRSPSYLIQGHERRSLSPLKGLSCQTTADPSAEALGYLLLSHFVGRWPS